jgi:hypothetical protein
MRTTPERQVSDTQRAQEQRASSPRYRQGYALTKGFTAALFPSKPHIPKDRAAVGQRLINSAQYRIQYRTAVALASYGGSWICGNCQVKHSNRIVRVAPRAQPEHHRLAIAQYTRIAGLHRVVSRKKSGPFILHYPAPPAARAARRLRCLDMFSSPRRPRRRYYALLLSGCQCVYETGGAFVRTLVR